MNWLVLFLFLTMPCVMGVAFTLAAPETTSPYGITTVLIIAVGWLLVAFQAGRMLKAWRRQAWMRWWLLLMVLLPFLVALIFFVWKDPEVSRAWAERKPIPATEHLAPAAPARHLPSWSETGTFVARVRAPAARFLIQLSTCLPPMWWIGALVLALWKGK
jgi:predicted membrane channel-forming protein YqfA (hemolysin III family)